MQMRIISFSSINNLFPNKRLIPRRVSLVRRKMKKRKHKNVKTRSRIKKKEREGEKVKENYSVKSELIETVIFLIRTEWAFLPFFHHGESRELITRNYLSVLKITQF